MTVRRIAALGALVLTLTASQPAAAHVRVTPANAAPGDRVEFELLVPGETRAHTIEVALRIPDGIRPSFERVPGWHRQLDKAADGSIEVVRWHGELARDGVGRFAFVATTPDHARDLVWKAVQRYDDGSEAAWIGPRGSDRPAPVTRVGAVTAAADDDAPAGAAALAIGAGLLLGAMAVVVARRRRHGPRAEAW